MKYFTKEWYKLMQKGCLNVCLLEINKAETFSDEYFQKIYKRQEKLEVDLAKSWYELCNTEKIYAYYQGTSAKERLKWKTKYLSNDEDYKLAIDERKKSFNELYNHILESLENNLPKEILSEIADIRLLALNRCTPKVKKLINNFCNENQKLVHESFEKYFNESEKSFEGHNTDIFQKLAFHDGKVCSCRTEGKDLILKVSDIDSASETGFGEITFKNYKLTGEDVDIKNATWLYEEIYKMELGYEFNVLLTKEDALIEFGIFADEIISTKKVYINID